VGTLSWWTKIDLNTEWTVRIRSLVLEIGGVQLDLIAEAEFPRKVKTTILLERLVSTAVRAFYLPEYTVTELTEKSEM